MKKRTKGMVFAMTAMLALGSLSLSGSCADSMDQAREISLNGSASDYLENYNEVNYYSFSLDRSGVVSLDFKHDNYTDDAVSWEISLYDEDSNKLYDFTSNQNKPKTSSCNIGLPEGEYYVKVECYNSYNFNDGEYVLKVNYERSNRWEQEQNDSFQQADFIELNTKYQGTIHDSDDQDYYRIRLDENGKVKISFEHDNFTKDSTSWGITLYDDESNELYTFYSDQNEIKAESCNIGLPAGEYYVNIYRPSYRDLHRGDYSFTVAYDSVDDWEQEDNNTIQNANTMIQGKVYNGSVKNDEDQDFYRVNVNEKGSYEIEFAHENYTEDRNGWQITLLDESSREMGKMKSKWNQKLARIKTESLNPGTYYIRVARESYRCSQDYSLSFNRANRKKITMQINNPIFTKEGQSLRIDEGGTTPVVIDGRTLVPVRAIIEAMGGTVEWEGKTQKVTLTYFDDKLTMNIGKTKAYLNGSSKTLDVAPRTINDRTMLPIRFIVENFGCEVGWDEATQTVSIYY